MILKKQFQQLAKASNNDLECLLKAGTAPDMLELVGWEYDGWNNAMPLGRGPKFRKGFQQHKSKDEDLYVTGYNVAMELDLLAIDPMKKPWTPKTDGPERFGFFDVRPADEEWIHNKYANSLVFDYNSVGLNPWPLCGTVDYVVTVDGNSDLLLGKFYMHPLSFNTGSMKHDSTFGVSTNYFLLLRANELSPEMDEAIKENYFKGERK